MSDASVVPYDPRSTYAVIMAGGVGSRFWPASREDRPKQFLDILGTGKSLLRMTFERFEHLCPASHIFIVTNARYRELVQEQLPELAANQILGEPSRNNTAPCVAYAAFKLHSTDPAANMVVAPSDHLILQEQRFIEQLKKALAFSRSNDALLTLGIQPTRPDSGYGYIQYEKAPTPEAAGIHRVRRFTEKPSPERARAFLESGDYLWNAGIFIWRAEAILEAFQQHAEDIYRILAAGKGVYNRAGEQAFIDEAYPTTPSLSVDYAIMEKASNIYTLPSSFGWSDLGTWASLHQQLPKDEAGNSVQGDRILVADSRDNLLRMPRGKLLVAGGLTDYIVVDEGDTLLIWPKSREQEIKQVSAEAIRRFGENPPE